MIGEGNTCASGQILWVEYKEQYPDGYTYSRYCYHFNRFLKHADVSMHLEYEAGDMIMIDFAGKKLRYIHPDGGEVIDVEVFIAIVPYSGLIFCKAVHTQRTAVFVSCINAMLKFYEAVPKTILCDNLKTAVNCGIVGVSYSTFHRTGGLTYRNTLGQVKVVINYIFCGGSAYIFIQIFFQVAVGIIGIINYCCCFGLVGANGKIILFPFSGFY